MTAPVRASYIAANYGLTARQWTRMAASGKIPGAYQPAGERGVWLFDLNAFKRWWETRRREVPSWQGYTSEAMSTGAAYSEAAKNIGGRSRRDLRASLENVLRNGSRS